MIENQIMLQKRISLSWWRSLLSKSVRAWQPMAQARPVWGTGTACPDCPAQAFREELERRLSRTSKSEDLKQNLVEAPVAEASAEAEVPAEVPRVSSAALSLSFSARETEVEALAPRSLLSPIAGSGSSSSSSPRTFVSQGSRSLADESSFCWRCLPKSRDAAAFSRRESSFGRGARGEHRPPWPRRFAVHLG